jgi:membrane protease YdiL (CAAX protease family)
MAAEVRPEGTRPPAGAVLSFAGCLYFAMIGAGALWLWQRERLAALPQAALGEHGLWVAAASGLSAGLLGSAVLALASRANAGVRACEQRIGAVLGTLRDAGLIALSMLSAVAEEFFFRLAVQDALGLPIAVALYVVLNTGPGFWSWAPVALGFGLLFGAMVDSGLGLLAATVAHAVVNYLSLRRILP